MAVAGRQPRDPLHLSFALTLWTDEPGLAARADAAGVDRVGLDLETLGKRERQAGLGTWISPHAEADLPAIRARLRRAQLFARTEPVNPGLAAQVDRLVEGGVEVLMLPMFTTAAEVARFVALVGGRARVVLLLETAEAVDDIDAVVAVPGVDEVHLGLNDLALSLGVSNRFGVLTLDAVARVASAVVGAGLRFGAGGLGRVDHPRRPIPSDLIYAQCARLGATAALISRSYLEPDPGALDLGLEVERTRRRLAEWAARPAAELEAARVALAERAAAAGAW